MTARVQTDIETAPPPLQAKPAIDVWTGKRYVYPAALIGLFVLALLLRLHGLNDTPIWTDESFSYIVAKLPLHTLAFGRIDNHPALYYFIQHIWQTVFPGLDAVRVPAAIIGALTVPLMAVATGDIVSRRAGLFAGVFLMLSTEHVYFSQDARMYTLVCLGLCLAIWGLLGMIERQRPILYGGLYLLGGTIAVYSQAIGLFFLAALNIAVFFAILMQDHRKTALLRFMAANGILLLISLPWLLALSANASTFPGLSKAGPEVIQWMMMNTLGFPGLETWPMRLGTFALIGLLFYGAARLWKAGDKTLPFVLLGSLLLYPVVIAVLSLHVNMIANRVFLPCVLVAAILYAASLDRLNNKTLKFSLFVVFSVLSLVSTLTEHGIRMKSENVTYALEQAAARGVHDGPVIGCGMFGTITPYLIADRPVYYLLGPSFMRVNAQYEKTYAMPINDHRTFDAQAIDRFASGGLIVDNASKEFAPYRHIMVMDTYCDAAKMAPTLAALTALGFHRSAIIPPQKLRPTLEINADPTDIWSRN